MLYVRGGTPDRWSMWRTQQQQHRHTRWQARDRQQLGSGRAEKRQRISVKQQKVLRVKSSYRRNVVVENGGDSGGRKKTRDFGSSVDVNPEELEN